MVRVVIGRGVVSKIYQICDYFAEICIETYKGCVHVIVSITKCYERAVAADRNRIVFILQWRMTRIIATQ